MPNKILRLVLGDQLNINHSWFDQTDDRITYVLFEMKQEVSYVRHHIQKIVGFFLAMRHFAEALRSDGHQVIYFTLDHPDNQQDLKDNIRSLIDMHHFDRFEYLLPDEYRLDQQLNTLCQKLDIPTRAYDTEHFLTERDELSLFFDADSYLMEQFYRDIRRKTGLLMKDDEPVGGQWNYDRANRKSLPEDVKIPAPKEFPRTVHDLVSMLEEQEVDSFGNIDPDRFTWPVTRGEQLELLDYFVRRLLPSFGDYQDALTTRSRSLFHSRLSFGLNTKQLSPREVVESAINYWKKHRDKISVNQVEGFVRQIIGWREFMRGVYWAEMPEYKSLNFFDHREALPDWFWTGNTKMHCLRHTIDQSLEDAYAHHIQRLMITGNFALLAGVHPDEVDAWYLGIYIDAVEWVEITNTRGMSQYADGGKIATKPYISSANYIDKMSDYCADCHYDPDKKTGARACPFNSLYWNFLARHRELLSDNHRMGLMYNLWDKKSKDDREDIVNQAEKYLSEIDNL